MNVPANPTNSTISGVVPSTKPKKILVVWCHPVAESFSGAIFNTVVSNLTARGHELEIIDLYREGFDPTLPLDEWKRETRGDGERSHDLAHAEHVRKLRWADTLVFVYPTWFGGFPAMLKGWFDRVWMLGVAYHLPEGGGVLKPGLSNIRRIVAFTTHGSPKYTNAFGGEAGKRQLRRGLRAVCHRLCRSTWVPFYGNDRVGSTEREKYLTKVETFCRKF